MSPTHAVATAACGNFTLAVPVAPLSAVVLFTLMQALLSAACGLTHAARPHTQGVILQVKAIKSYVDDRNAVRKAYMVTAGAMSFLALRVAKEESLCGVAYRAYGSGVGLVQNNPGGFGWGLNV